LKEQLEAQSSAAAAPSKAAFESVDAQPYSPSEEELHEVFVEAQKAKLHGIEDSGELKSLIGELLSHMPNFSNGKHSGLPSLTSVEYQAFDTYSNPSKLDKKAIAAIFGKFKGYGNFTHGKYVQEYVDLAQYYDSVKGSGPSFQALTLGSTESYLHSIGASLAQSGAQFEYQPNSAE
jgi:hypothetical protein